MIKPRRASEPDVAAVAALIADPSRALMLQALADASARPATELARMAGITPQTASAHLARLVDGRLVLARQQGRHRYYRLRDSRVAELLETVASFAPVLSERVTVADPFTRDLRFARTCYQHLAGKVGVAVTDALCAEGALRDVDAGYEITSLGRQWFDNIAIDLDSLRARPLTKRCLDWSERRYHLSGPLGAALARRFLDLQWIVRRRGSRALRLTERGRQELRRVLSLEL